MPRASARLSVTLRDRNDAALWSTALDARKD